MTLDVQKCLYNSEFLIESEARIVGIAKNLLNIGMCFHLWYNNVDTILNNNILYNYPKLFL